MYNETMPSIEGLTFRAKDGFVEVTPHVPIALEIEMIVRDFCWHTRCYRFKGSMEEAKLALEKAFVAVKNRR